MLYSVCALPCVALFARAASASAFANHIPIVKNMNCIRTLTAAVSTHSRRLSALLTAVALTVVPLTARAQDGATIATDGSSPDLLVGQPTAWALGLQPGVTPVKDKMHFFHNALLLPIITVIVLFVLLLLIVVVARYRAAKNPVASRTTHNTMLEVVWTLIPVLILVVIVIPSMKMLYFVDKTHEPEMTLKVTGYQWYWGYSYPDQGIEEFSANMVPEADLKDGQPRLLAADAEVVLPVDTNVRVLVTANDVIHSWAVPAFGVKTDAVPGRTNETWVRVEKEGTYYGQCSEICGVNHAFMPIQVRAVSKEAFADWVKSQGGSMPAPGSAPAAGVEEGSSAPAAAPADAEAATKTPQEMTEQDKAVSDSATEKGDAVDDAAKAVADPIPSEKAGE